MLEGLVHDLKDALRAVARTPVAAVVAAITLALGVTANTAVFSVFESILLNPLTYLQPERLVSLAVSDGPRDGRISAWMAHEWQLRVPSIAAIGLYTDGQWVLTGDGEPEVLRGQRVNAQFFDTLGVGAELGRVFTADEDRSPRANVFVLSHELWVTRFGADPSLVGRVFTLNGAPYRLVGVLGESFQPFRMANAAEQPRMYAPLGFDTTAAARCRRCDTATAIARLADGASVQRARDEINTTMDDFRRDHPDDFAATATVRVDPLQQRMTAALRPALWIAVAAAACVLLIACANVAGLQLARVSARAGELAVRGALGGSRARLFRLLLLESLVVAAAGCAAGVLLGRNAVTAILALAPRELPRLGEVALDARVLLASLAAGLLTAIAAGLAPAFAASRTNLNDVLKRNADQRGGGAPRGRNALVVCQITLAFVLVSGAGLLVRTVHGLLTLDAGFDASHVITMTPVFSSPNLMERQTAVDAVAALPGVRAAGLVNDVPLSHTNPFRYDIDGDTMPPDAARQANVFWIEGGYFAALRIPLRQGRFLSRHDDQRSPAAVVSESLARRRFPGGDAIGRRMRIDGGPWLPIVGIVGDVHNAGLDVGADEAVYQPLAMNPTHYIRLVARGTGEPLTLEPSIRAALRRVDPLVAIFHVQPMDGYVASSMARRRFALSLTSAFAILALTLACVGLYAVLNYAVVLRLPEFGVRAALGATARDLLQLILGDAARLVGAGLAMGLVLALAATRGLASLLYGVGAVDLRTFASAAAVIAAAALVACLLPARRAARVDPLRIMRGDSA